jgi:hypothetical protein
MSSRRRTRRAYTIPLPPRPAHQAAPPQPAEDLQLRLVLAGDALGPTSAAPGSEAKIAILTERARLGVSLFVHGDLYDTSLPQPEHGGAGRPRHALKKRPA